MKTNFFIDELSSVKSNLIGHGTRIWQYVVILKGAEIGSDCNICSHCLIEGDVVLGDRVTVKSGVQLWDGVRIGDDVFVGPNVSFTNDRFPRSRKKPDEFIQTIIRNGASIGAGAVILPGITIESNALVGAGAVVTRSVPANAIVVGNPAKIVGYIDAGHSPTQLAQAQADTPCVYKTGVSGVNRHHFSVASDIRGSLIAGEFEQFIPFHVKRYFLVFDVPSMETRGQHAHYECHQFLTCVKGSCVVVADDGENREEFLLDSPNTGLHLPPMTWGIQYKYSDDCVLLVFASHHYDDSDYIRDYSTFLNLVNK